MSDYPETSDNTWPEATPHLSDELLAAWAADELANGERALARRHLESCTHCRRALAETQRIQALVRAAAHETQSAMTPSLARHVLARLPEESISSSDIHLHEARWNAEPTGTARRRDAWARMGALAAALLLIVTSALLFTRLAPRAQTNIPAPTATPVELANLPGVWKTVIPTGATIWDIAVVSPADIWAAGSVASAGEVKTVLVHFDGARWRLSPDVFTNAGLYSISMVSATDGWAAGSLDGAPFMLHYTGGHWRDATTSIDTIALTDHKIVLTHVRMATATSGWALGQGDQQPPQPTQILQYLKEGTTYRWEPTESLDGVTLNALSVVSDREAWMVGAYGKKTIIVRVLIVYLNNDPNSTVTTWYTNSWDVGNGSLTSVSMSSSAEGWVGGTSSQGVGALFHWDGQQWTQMDARPNGQPLGPIQGIVMTGTNTGWVFGTNADITRAYLYSMANNHWYAYPLRTNAGILSAVAITPSSLLATTDLVATEGYDPIPALFDMKTGALVP